jgi:hypothetical protein
MKSHLRLVPPAHSPAGIAVRAESVVLGPRDETSTTDPAPGSPRWEGDLGGGHFQTLSRVTGDDFKRHALDFLYQTAAAVDAPVSIDRVRYLDLWPIDAMVTTVTGQRFALISHGCFDDTRLAGLRRSDTVLKMLGAIHSIAAERLAPVVVLTSHLPDPGSQAGRLLAASAAQLGVAFVDVVATSNDFAGTRRLQVLLRQPVLGPNVDAPWRRNGTSRQLDLFTQGGR